MLDFITVNCRINMHHNKGVNLSLDTRIEEITDPTKAVISAAENWRQQFQQNRLSHENNPQKWSPEPVRHEAVLPGEPAATFIEAIGAAAQRGCQFIVELEDTKGNPKQLLIDSNTTTQGINLALGIELLVD